VAGLLALVGCVGCFLVGIRWWTLLPLVLAPLELFNVLSIAPYVTRYRFRRNPKFAGPAHVTFDDAGIHYRAAGIDSQLSWSLYQELVEDPQLMLLVYGGSMFTVLPKRCFVTPEQEGAFRALVASKLATAR